MSEMVRIVGPPGAGKTTFLSRQIERAAEKYPADLVMVCSFTRAAVRELLSRDLPIPDNNVGTLHSLAYRSLDNPEICETAKHLKAFSEEHPKYAMGGGTREDVDDGHVPNGNGGDGLLMEYARLRAIMRPQDLWSSSVQRFAKIWEDYKEQTGTMDFTDLIEVALKDVERPQCYPVVGFFDEAQDFSRLEAALAKKWAATMIKAVFVYDPAQAIYTFKGADPNAIHDETAVFTTLQQSYRLPSSIKDAAERLLGRMKMVRSYAPRAEGGEVVRSNFTIKDANQIIDLAGSYTEQYQSVLVLTSCGYMLNPLLAEMKRQGIPFANPFRRRRRDWNPLHRIKKQCGAAERVEAYLTGFNRQPNAGWTVPELHRWLGLTKGVTRRKWEEAVANVDDETVLSPGALMEIMDEENLEGAMYAGLPWLETRLNATWVKTAPYAIRVGAKDPVALVEEPLLETGTVHSVKGGEASVVILCPDISPQGAQEMSTTEGRHSNIRQFYTGMTRARDTLIWLAPSSRLSFPWREM